MTVYSSRLGGGSVILDPGTPDIYTQRLPASTGGVISTQPYVLSGYVVADYVDDGTFARAARVAGSASHASTAALLQAT